MLGRFQAYQLAVELYRGVEGYQGREYVRDQVQRACLSVVLNLAEGSAKPTAKERQRFYGVALASLREVQAIIEVTGAVSDLWPLADRLGGMLYRLSRPV